MANNKNMSKQNPTPQVGESGLGLGVSPSHEKQRAAVKYYTLIYNGKDISILEESYKSYEQATLCKAGDINVECPLPKTTTLEQFLVEIATARQVKIVERSEHSIVFEVIPY
jgi:phage anti-repressor protein